ncbi:MAG TPA: TonB-dependent receptor [Cyclobacteriaceae bacterium]|nr:TonB-dependent receptor [Cyclobacteriaceae bacterium]
MKRLIISVSLLMLLPLFVQAQKLMGVVVEKDNTGKDQPLPGANVYWSGTTKGTTTRDNGVFLIDRIAGNQKLVISFVGYKSDTLTITDQANVKVELQSEQVLNEVTVEGWRPATHFNPASGINQVVMTEKELFKAACCNLSESFETNPSVDVAFTDAITGTRQIQMLGLSGPNTMISLENMPGVRGLASSQGIQFIPGTWINSIQVTKGTGSVVNGYESLAGQINVELKKPQESDKLFLNGYVNNSGRSEANLIYTTQTGKKWGTTFLVHGSTRPLDMDQNHDGFLDFPKGQQVNFVNRWTYNSGTGWLGQVAIKYLDDTKQGGQVGFNPERDKFTTNKYGFEINTKRTELVGKLGYQFAGKPYKSFGFQFNALQHDHDSYFGFTTYGAKEQSLYANLIYQSIIGSTQHKFKTGLSFLADDYDENFAQASSGSLGFNRAERVPGAFFEYTYDAGGKLSVIAGVRVDQHNLFGTLFVPRLHTRYNLTETTTIRGTIGKGIRVANVLNENAGFMASSRALVLSRFQSSHAYGFNPDVAWNYGLNVLQEFTLDYRPGSLSVDYYFTDFKNQVVMDLDHNTQEVNFFGLQGKSFSHSVQVQLDYQLIRRLDVRLAYRWLDVETDYLDGRRERPLIPKDRSFVNVSYKTKNAWAFDYTIQRIGRQRLPQTLSSPAAFQLGAYSDPYWMMNAQVSKDMGSRWSVYVGVENLTDFKLSNPIVSANDPFGAYFDTSMVWGPVFGRMGYAGFRYRIK